MTSTSKLRMAMACCLFTFPVATAATFYDSTTIYKDRFETAQLKYWDGYYKEAVIYQRRMLFF